MTPMLLTLALIVITIAVGLKTKSVDWSIIAAIIGMFLWVLVFTNGGRL